MKALYAITIAVFLAACATPPQQSTTDYDSQGRIVRTTASMTSQDYADSQIALHKANCQAQYYGVPERISDGRDLALLAAIRALNPKDPCPTVTSSRDVEIAKANERWSTFRTFINKIPLIGGIVGGTIVGRQAVRNRDPVVVEQPQPLIVRPEVVDPVIVSPEVIEVGD